LIKVYAMIGLPTESDDDLEELVRLAEDILAAGRRVTGGRKVQVKVSVGCFVPKAWTPFQWQPYAGVEELRRRIRFLKERFRRIRGARLTWSDPEEAALEALLSRGGRQLSSTIERAHDLGAVFDGWTDYVDLKAWRAALDQTGVDVDRELGERVLSEALPWDFMDAGVRKGFLKAEWRRALRETETEDCKWGHCYRCGIPGDGEDTRLAPTTLPVLGEALPENERPKAAAYKLRPEPRTPPAAEEKPQPPVHRRYRFVFTKGGDARWLSHRQVMDALERMVRAARLPVRFTEGYNPHIRLSMGPALPVGYEGRAEVFDVDCTAPLRPHHLERANSLLPEGVQILDARPLLPGVPKLGRVVAAARYRIAVTDGIDPWPESEARLSEEIRNGIRRWQLLDNGDLLVELNARQDNQLSVKKLLLALGVAGDRVARVPVIREMLVLEARNRGRDSSKTEPEVQVS
jgi:radical SAM-linked protein